MTRAASTRLAPRSSCPQARPRLGTRLAAALAGGTIVALIPASFATASVVRADGPISLGAATSFAVLASSTVTNTGETDITGDVGVSAGSAITGLPSGQPAGVGHAGDAVAIEAQVDVTAAYNQLSSLTPTDATTYTELSGLTLGPGVYSAGAASITGTLTLNGDANSLWVFQVGSTLTTGSGSSIVMTGGADACNVFWRVPSSVALGTNSTFEGTVIAGSSIAAQTGAVIDGRLLAQTEAVTLDDNLITVSDDCSEGTVITESPTITTGPVSSATVGTPYSSTITSSGSPVASYTVTAGSLPAGLSLDSTTGVVSGTPTTSGTYSFTVTAANAAQPDASQVFSITVAAAAPAAPTAPAASSARPVPVLAATGADGDAIGGGALLGAALMALGALALTSSRAARRIGLARHRG